MISKEIKSCYQKSFAFSDHQAVFLELNDSSIPITKITNFYHWKLNTSLLKEDDFNQYLETFINNAKNRKHLYDNLLDWWEIEIKAEGKRMLIYFSTIIKKEKNSKKNFYQRCLDQVKTEIDNGKNYLQEYYYFKDKLKCIFNEELEGRKLRGKLNFPLDQELVGIANLVKEKNKRENRYIENLKTNNNETKSKTEDILKIVENFYNSLYKLDPHDSTQRNILLEHITPVIPETVNSSLTEDITDIETWDAINSLSEQKSPGIDGLPIEFYKKIWPLLKKEFVKILNFILSQNLLTETQNTALITLIHKGGEKDLLKNYRPISLLCSDYKILAKILTNRIKKTLPIIISQEQTGGMTNRQITQNLNSYRNIITHFTEENPNNAAIVSLDFEKAYDRVDRQFLYKVMAKFGFDPKFINFIKTLYDNAKAKALVNGTPSEPIHLKRGVRQGCPLAMYLYIIFLEPFLLLLKNKISPTYIKQSPYLLTAFVDDVSITISKLSNFKVLNECISTFEKGTNSKVNKSKTQTLALGTWINNKTWPESWIQPQEPIKILGIQWCQNIEKTIELNCQSIVTKIKQSFEATFNRNLTIHQKTIYCNCFIAPKLGYISKVLPIPKNYSNIIEQIAYKFIWRHRLESLAKREIYPPIKMGGLNLLNITNKCSASFLNTFLKDLFNPNDTSNKLTIIYWTALKLKKLVKTKNIPRSENPPEFLKEPLNILQNLMDNMEVNETTTEKIIYTYLNKQCFKTPKIITKNPNTDFSNAFNALTKPFLSSQTKEHIFFVTHNILPTKDRQIKCRRVVNEKSDLCNLNEDLMHIFTCEKTLPATKFIQRKIAKLYKSTNLPSIKDICLFKFPPTPKATQNTAIWIAANFTILLWKTRKKANFMQHFINKFKSEENAIKHHKNYNTWFSPTQNTP